MALKKATRPLRLKRYRNDEINTTVFHEAELVGDFRSETPNLRIGDGVTPGGIIVAVGDIIGSIKRPSIIAPLNGATGIITSPIITANVYSAIGLDGGTDPHVASRWVFSTDAAQTNVLYDSGRTTEALIEFDAQEEGLSLPDTTLIYVSVAFESEGGLENKSPVISFTTV